ncbi:MAG: class I SAM-dependent methyltransferase [Verrucomicrobiota bacterium]
MASDLDPFYLDTLRRLVREGVMDPASSLLCVCAGERDHRTLKEAGFPNVTLTNLETRWELPDPGTHRVAYGDVENLTFPDKSFDFVIAHNGLHHCASPHRGLLEMHRVARKGLLVFEPRDSWISRLGVRLGLGQDYEAAAVALSEDRVSGGWRNGPVPNYVYRWTEREIEKTIRSATPWMVCGFRYFHATRPPSGAARRSNPWIRMGLRLAIPLATILGRILPSQTNCFAFLVTQPPAGRGSPPWIRWTDGVPSLDPEWARRKYQQ